MTEPHRSYLFAPGDHARRVKVLTLAADAVILDLEDAVALSAKVAARDAVAAALDRPRRGRCHVRVNGFVTPLCFGDLQAVIRPGLDGIVLPMLEAPAQLVAVDWAMAALERQRGLPERGFDLIPIIETACGDAGRPRAPAGLRCGDYTLDLGVTWTREEAELAAARSEVVLASRSAGLVPPIDIMFAELDKVAAFARSCERGAALGFQGKMCIHPDQLEPANAAFGPAPDEAALAQRIVAAFGAAEASGAASIQLEGRFVDYPIAARTRRTLALPEAIAATEQRLPGRDAV